MLVLLVAQISVLVNLHEMRQIIVTEKSIKHWFETFSKTDNRKFGNSFCKELIPNTKRVSSSEHFPYFLLLL